MVGEKLTIDESRWPVVVLTLKGALQEADYRKMYAGLEALMRRRQPYLVISDLRRVTEVANARRRQEIADWSEQMKQRHGDYGLGSIYVVESSIVKGSLTALQWLMNKQDPDIFVNSMSEAYQQAEKLLKRAKLDVPPSLDTAGDSLRPLPC